MLNLKPQVFLLVLVLIAVILNVSYLTSRYKVHDKPVIFVEQPSNFDQQLTTTQIVDKYSELRNQSLSSHKVNGCFFSLARNSDLWEIVDSIRSVQDRFNNKFNYDWVFLNDEEFTDEFKQVTLNLITGKATYGRVPEEHWLYPQAVDLEKAAEGRKKLADMGVIYGESESYRHMCRFQSGFFFHHPLLASYDWYWRVEPSVRFSCDIDYDLFEYMEKSDKVYGFAISIQEFEPTIPTLWQHTKDFMTANPHYLHKNNLLNFVSEDAGKTYNLCHFWSNFEIVNLNFYRSQAYQEYFDHLDATQGFFYERWGDAPIHSIAASLFLDKSQVHMFQDFGYSHSIYQSCPIDDKVRAANRCDCNKNNDFTFRGYSCGNQFFKAQNLAKPANWKDYSG